MILRGLQAVGEAGLEPAMFLCNGFTVRPNRRYGYSPVSPKPESRTLRANASDLQSPPSP